jgi:hypothetical protein
MDGLSGCGGRTFRPHCFLKEEGRHLAWQGIKAYGMASGRLHYRTSFGLEQVLKRVMSAGKGDDIIKRSGAALRMRLNHSLEPASPATVSQP